MALPEAAEAVPDCPVCADLDAEYEEYRRVEVAPGRFAADHTALTDVRVKRRQHWASGACARSRETT
ncbi:hypothetical protein [Kitasatospora kifunensis]|uniref:Uncharacterized protein n=1 Tax=Kitasatospora kifunensis TaxID=58351 RepID=A0A7W7R7X5_KITKI|nr:hypothetical protein [Kitasatospora kifunensis]MBB4927077.1 hypothetical protein [Kitasatospora kifunensis]